MADKNDTSIIPWNLDSGALKSKSDIKKTPAPSAYIGKYTIPPKASRAVSHNGAKTTEIKSKTEKMILFRTILSYTLWPKIPILKYQSPNESYKEEDQ